jgi:multidrug efflux pump subunit AcrA (membrane-fusion protein)
MSQVTAPASPAPHSERPETPSRSTEHVARWQKRVLIWAIVCAGLGLIFFYGARSYRALMGSKEAVIPVAKVQRGDVSLAITARGELRVATRKI